jgi:aryl-alcohol dehydrogenase-like predicted oxidoreductase
VEHRSIGALSVSVVGLGCNQLGTAACDEAASQRVLAEALDAGIQFFDTSDEYGRNYADSSDLTGWGRSEEILGRVLRSRRDEVVMATKFGPPGPLSDDPDDELYSAERSHASARGVQLAAEGSLRRLQTDRIDLFQLHFPDPRFPIDETLAALDDLVRDGKVREIGCCNLSGTELRAAAAAAHDLGLRRFVSAQNSLNILQRAALDGVMPACEELDMAFIPYYPLASGVLTGKYRREAPTPAGARVTEQFTDEARRRVLSERTFARLDALEAFAQSRSRSLLELAFAWLLGHPRVASVIAGATRPDQVRANAAAADWRLSPDEVDEVTRTVASVG